MKNFLLIKPDTIEREIVDDVVNCFLRYFKVYIFEPKIVTIQLILEHYKTVNTTDKEFEKKLIDYFVGKEVIPALIEGGPDCIAKSRKLIGHTDPLLSPSNTIRGRYGKDSLELAISEGRLCENLVHASDSEYNYLRERNIWISEGRELNS